jgi:hypothetical protein
MAQPPEDDTFFSRWSKRKRAAIDETQTDAPATAPIAEPTTVPDAPETESLSEEELAALPSLEELTPETDIRPFLRKGVPQAMRNAALRKMWMLTPAIRDYKNPAVDYAWDWNTPGGVPGDGVAPTPARAAEMLRELMAPRRNAAPANTPETDEKESTPAHDPDVVSAPQNAATGADHTASTQPSFAAKAETQPEKTKVIQSSNEEPPPRRRHGSALPD